MNKITANLLVERIETALPFWVDRLGFTKTVEVPEGDRLGFVILTHGETELMLQTRASMKNDVAPLADGTYRSMLYVEVKTLAPIRTALKGWPLVVPERDTFYGAREIIVKDPEGNVVAFAEPAPAAK